MMSYWKFFINSRFRCYSLGKTVLWIFKCKYSYNIILQGKTTYPWKKHKWYIHTSWYLGKQEDKGGQKTSCHNLLDESQHIMKIRAVKSLAVITFLMCPDTMWSLERPMNWPPLSSKCALTHYKNYNGLKLNRPYLPHAILHYVFKNIQLSK